MSDPAEQETPSERGGNRRQGDDRRSAQTKLFENNHYVFREHETGQEAYIIKSGQVEIIKTVTEDSLTTETTLGILGEGTMFGEMALIDDSPRMASARAYQGRLEVLVVSQDQFSALLEPVNPFVKKLLGILADHVRASNAKQDSEDT